MIKKYLNKFKIEKIKKIETDNNYIYFFRYNDLKCNEKNALKKEIKNLNFNSLVLKQNLIKKYFNFLTGQGSLVLLFSNKYIDIKLINQKIKKLEFIYLLNKNFIFSNKKIFKINKSYKNNEIFFLNLQFKNPIFNFYRLLKKINK